MIVDNMTYWRTYCPLVPHLEVAIEFALQVADQKVGRYECKALPKGDVYVIIQEGETKPYEEGLVEAHRRYLDVHIILRGVETVYYTDISGLEEIVPYDDEKDVLFLERAGQPIQIKEGMFYIMYPQDGHIPCRHSDGPERYRKLVVKIKL